MRVQPLPIKIVIERNTLRCKFLANALQKWDADLSIFGSHFLNIITYEPPSPKALVEIHI